MVCNHFVQAKDGIENHQLGVPFPLRLTSVVAKKTESFHPI